MARGSMDRGVSEVIGFILLFAFLVGAFTLYQGLVVPEQNRQVEFQHNQDVQGDLQDLRNAILGTASTGSGQSVSVEMGATYPARTIAYNLGISAGSVQTGVPETVRLENARALDGETQDYLDGGSRMYETQTVRYQPVYSFYSTAPDTIYENTLVFNRFDGENITLTDQVMIDGRRVTIVALNGSLDVSRQGTFSVSPEAISSSTNRVAVRNTPGERVNLTVPTRLPASAWEELLADEMGPEGYVEAVEPVPGEDAVKLVLQGGVTYDLRMAKVGVGMGTAQEDAKYVTDVEGDQTSVPEGGRQQLVVEVRDRFNNPVSNVSVSSANSPSWGSVSPGSRTTDSDGRAIFSYRATDDVDQTRSDTVELAFDGDGTANESVAFAVDVLDTDGSGGGGDDDTGTDEINPSGGDAVQLIDSSRPGNDQVDIVLDNTGDSTVTFNEFRVSFMYRQGGDPPDDVAEIHNESTGTTYQSSPAEIGSSMQSFDTNDVSIPPGEFTLSVRFSDQIQNSFFIVTFRTDDDDTNTYFVSVP